VDAICHDSRLGVEVSRPGAVLFRFAAEYVMPAHFEQVDMAALVDAHVLVCPPQGLLVHYQS
jgi:hypothetical protein